MSTKQLLDFRKIKIRSEFNKRTPDKETQKLLYYLFTSTRGGFTRLRIIMMLPETPMNTHRLAQELGLQSNSTPNEGS